MYLYWRSAEFVGDVVEFEQLEKVLLTRLLLNGVASPSEIIDLKTFQHQQKVLYEFVDKHVGDIASWKQVPTLPLSSVQSVKPLARTSSQQERRTKSERLSAVEVQRLQKQLPVLEKEKELAFAAGDAYAKKMEGQRRTRAITKEVKELFKSKINLAITKRLGAAVKKAAKGKQADPRTVSKMKTLEDNITELHDTVTKLEDTVTEAVKNIKGLQRGGVKQADFKTMEKQLATLDSALKTLQEHSREPAQHDDLEGLQVPICRQQATRNKPKRPGVLRGFRFS